MVAMVAMVATTISTLPIGTQTPTPWCMAPLILLAILPHIQALLLTACLATPLLAIPPRLRATRQPIHQPTPSLLPLILACRRLAFLLKPRLLRVPNIQQRQELLLTLPLNTQELPLLLNT